MEFQHKPAKRLTYREKAQAGLIERKTRKPMDRSSKLKPASKKREKWLEKYRAKKASDVETQTCPVCGIAGMKGAMDAHHTHGRGGESILRYIYVHRECHDWIHGHPKQAREKGFLCF